MQEFKTNVNGKDIVFQVKNLAEQANGEVLVRCGDTTLLATCVMGKEDLENPCFFPLSVEYQERYYAAGKIKGPRYIKREGRPSDEAVCNARLIDRTIRPLFPKELKRDVQVIITVLSWDEENDPDVLGVLAASMALSISDIPWQGPLGALRACYLNTNRFILNPNYKEREEASLDIMFSGTLEQAVRINMIEAEGDQVPEKTIIKAFEAAEKDLEKLIKFQEQVAKKIGKEKITVSPCVLEPEIEAKAKEILEKNLEQAVYQKDKTKRQENLLSLRKELTSLTESELVLDLLGQETSNLLTKNIIDNENRPDQRTSDEIRDLFCDVSVLPRTHGSSVFSRGQTKSLSILTLGAPGDQQILEGMEVSGKKRFMHHYNFPPYCTGEVKPMRGPARRDIGHGMLVEKAIAPVIPSIESFPYTIRVVSEILSSNGSSSMAAVCSTSLALLDAGVPVKEPVAGIAMGLVKKGKDYRILTDIQGPEDQSGQMDFKVAGTKNGATAIQLDTKVSGISKEIFEKTLEKAKEARLKILDVANKTISSPRGQLSPYAPRILILQINPDKIREVIGPGGKVINEIIDETKAAIDIQDSGLIYITAENETAAQKAVERIKDITREVKVNEVFQGKIKRILNFGAFAEILPNQEGLIHISELSDSKVNKVEDVVKIGDIVQVKVISIDDQGRINLSLKKAKKVVK